MEEGTSTTDERQEEDMYTVIVADDEEEIRRSLIRRVNWGEAGFQVVGEAENGAEALELVERLEPDLLLSDIRMPFIDGIELARQVQETRPATQIAFLSGYDDFSYAQQAIQYNIISYLLKPISAKELERELVKMREKIDRKYREFRSQSMRQDHMEKAEFLMPLLLDGLMEDWQDQEYEDMLRYAKGCGLADQEENGELRYVVIVTRILSREGENVTSRASVQSVDSILKKYVKHCSIYLRGRVVSLLSGTAKELDQYLHILVEDISQSVERIMRMRGVVGVSRITDKLSGSHECYLEAMSAIENYGRMEGNIHFISDDSPKEELDNEMLQHIAEDMENLAQRFPVLGARIFGTAARAKKFYLEVCANARNIMREQHKKSGATLCHSAIRIIDERYMEPELSLVSVSADIGISPNYLSALLKKQTGTTFKELLTKRRIETAQKMLIDTEMKVREIAEKCGYRDQHYFSYCFKKYTGISPNGCRGQNGEKNG